MTDAALALAAFLAAALACRQACLHVHRRRRDGRVWAFLDRVRAALACEEPRP